MKKRLAAAALTAFVGVLALTLIASTNRLNTNPTASHYHICPSGYRSVWHWVYPHWTCEESGD
jgi:hypothetical protein